MSVDGERVSLPPIRLRGKLTGSASESPMRAAQYTPWLGPPLPEGSGIRHFEPYQSGMFAV